MVLKWVPVIDECMLFWRLLFELL